MEGVSFEAEHPKKRRRRHYSERPLSAHLVLDDSLMNFGVVSEDLWIKLNALDRDSYGMLPSKDMRQN